jgi:hypothetical protein
VRFAGREHHTCVPYKHVEHGFELGRWVTKQRTAKRAGRISPERAIRLEALPGWVWSVRPTWTELPPRSGWRERLVGPVPLVALVL